MSYNQAYEQDSGENVSYNSLYSLDVIRRNTLLPVIKGSQVTLPPQPVVYFDLQTWEANQTVLSKNGSIYETVLKSYPDYADGLTWVFVPDERRTIIMVENVTFPPQLRVVITTRRLSVASFAIDHPSLGRNNNNNNFLQQVEVLNWKSFGKTKG